MIIAELNRIASHLVAAGCYGLDLGSFTPFMWTFREREKILNLFEEVCGARLTYSYITAGGVTADLPAGWLQKCEAFSTQFEPVIDELHALLTSNAIFIHRTAGIGVLPAAMAIDYGCTGPGAARQRRRLGPAPRRRAALHARCTTATRGEVIAQIDGRYPHDHPYPPVPRRGRAGRLAGTGIFVRMLEVVQSMDLIRQAMEKYAQAAGEVDEPIELKKKLPKGEAYLETEAPKGQMGFMIISDGSPVPWRVRIRSSSFCNLSVMPEILPRRAWWPTCRRSSARWIWCWERLIGRD